MRCNYANTKEGDKVIFDKSSHHWFRDRIKNAESLNQGETYTVSQIRVASSSTAVRLVEMDELDFELSWFSKE